jgi:hypothetical protein
MIEVAPLLRLVSLILALTLEASLLRAVMRIGKRMPAWLEGMSPLNGRWLSTAVPLPFALLVLLLTFPWCLVGCFAPVGLLLLWLTLVCTR